MRTSNTARGLPRALGAFDIRSGGRGLLLPIHGRAAASGALFLAHGWQQVFDAAFKHFRRPKYHGRAERL